MLKFYLDNINQGNNWDLVDLIAPKILGRWILCNPEGINILFQLSDREDSLWHQRVAIVATLPLIKKRNFNPTLLIAEKYISHKQDLIHKATGWMLREVGKNGGESLLQDFLDKKGNLMPRTMLR